MGKHASGDGYSREANHGLPYAGNAQTSLEDVLDHYLLHPANVRGGAEKPLGPLHSTDDSFKA